MKLKIEKPDFQEIASQHCSDGHLRSIDFSKIDAWFAETIEPINKLLAEAEELFGTDDGCWFDSNSQDFNTNTHHGYIIGVEPLKKETAADVLREIYDAIDNRCIVTDSLMLRAKRVLGDSE